MLYLPVKVSVHRDDWEAPALRIGTNDSAVQGDHVRNALECHILLDASEQPVIRATRPSDAGDGVLGVFPNKEDAPHRSAAIGFSGGSDLIDQHGVDVEALENEVFTVGEGILDESLHSRPGA